MENTQNAWRQHFSQSAADLLQIQRAFAGEDVFKRLLMACFRRQRARSMKINERTVLAVLQADTKECEA
jgi:hypothetical protein